MTPEIREEPIQTLAAHGRVSIAFTVRARMRVVEQRLVEERVEPPYAKDYDTAGEGGPADWPARFDVSSWGLLVARVDGQRVGGAVVAWNTPGLDMLEGRADRAVLWDLRVDPAWRRQGVGGGLFQRAVDWARARGCVRLDVETQDVNVPACRFYASRGCALRSTQPHAYPTCPDETRLLWSLPIS